MKRNIDFFNFTAYLENTKRKNTEEILELILCYVEYMEHLKSNIIPEEYSIYKFH